MYTIETLDIRLTDWCCIVYQMCDPFEREQHICHAKYLILTLLLGLIDLIFGVLTPLSTLFQLYHGDQF